MLTEASLRAAGGGSNPQLQNNTVTGRFRRLVRQPAPVFLQGVASRRDHPHRAALLTVHIYEKRRAKRPRKQQLSYRSPLLSQARAPASACILATHLFRAAVGGRSAAHYTAREDTDCDEEIITITREEQGFRFFVK